MPWWPHHTAPASSPYKPRASASPPRSPQPPPPPLGSAAPSHGQLHGATLVQGGDTPQTPGLLQGPAPPLGLDATYHEQLDRATSRGGAGQTAVRVLSQRDLDAIQSGMEREGVFEREPVIHTEHLADFENQLGKPPVTIAWGAYDDAMKRVIRTVGVVARDRKADPIYLIRASNRGGGNEGQSHWFCKSHVYTFMLYRRQNLIPHEQGLLLVSDEASAEDLYAVIPATQHNARLLFVHFLDGVYTGEEARSLADRLRHCVRPEQDSFLLAATISKIGGRQFGDDDAPNEGPYDTYITQFNRAVTPKIAALNKPSDSTIMVVGLGVSSGQFVLPFKIADRRSLTVWSALLKAGNAGFIPPYKRSKLCQDPRRQPMGSEEVTRQGSPNRQPRGPSPQGRQGSANRQPRGPSPQGRQGSPNRQPRGPSPQGRQDSPNRQSRGSFPQGHQGPPNRQRGPSVALATK